MHTGGDVKIVHRTETLPAYGWMITREFFEEVYNVWFESNKVSILETVLKYDFSFKL